MLASTCLLSRDKIFLFLSLVELTAFTTIEALESALRNSRLQETVRELPTCSHAFQFSNSNALTFSYAGGDHAPKSDGG
jgi:hypothetical protein